MAKVIVGMSGGVDSAAAAYLLKQAGYDVIGLTLRTWVSEDGEDSRCCEINDARMTAWKIGIPYYTWNCIPDFQEHVIVPFMDEYLCGRTPNPCTLCNRFVKWDKMLYVAKVLQADYIATGHYASVVKLDNGRYTFRKAAHAQKDQTYMLYKLTQDQIASTLMPLGGLTKDQVRDIAREAGLPVAEKADSQEVCFVSRGSYADFITENAGKARNPRAPQSNLDIQNTQNTWNRQTFWKSRDSILEIPGPGNFVDEAGHILGRHKGIIHYTAGQRKGLGLSLGYPAYVKRIDPANNEVVICQEENLYRKTIICRDVNLMSIESLAYGESLACRVKIRYHHPGEEAVIEKIKIDGSLGSLGNPGSLVRITFAKHVKAPAPGQAAVFYDKNDCLIGGGVIIL